MIENTTQISGWTVLIVDDEPDNLGVPRKILTHFGAQVHTAENGEQGLALLATIRPTFVLLDLSMPKMDGWTMLREMRAREHLAPIPVIALTAHAMQSDRDRALAAGFDGYISKPFRLDTLLQDITTCLQTVDPARMRTI